MNRSTYGMGSTRLRPDGRWEHRVYDRETKKQKTYRGATKAEALAGPRRAHETAVRAAQSAQDVTVAEYLDGWLSARRAVVRASTWKRNASMIQCWVIPALGAKRLRDVTTDDLHRLYETAGKTLAPGSVRNVHAVVGLAFEAAVREGKLPRNPSRSVKAPRAGDRHWTVLTRAQAAALLDAAKGDDLEALWVLALSTGMRSGELLALRWSDIHLDDAYLTVERTVTQKAEGGLTTADPKTRAGRRTVPLITRAIAVLREHYDRSGASRKRGSALVFPGRNGGIMFSSNMLVQKFRPLLAKAGLPTMRFHDLRHSAATAMILDGAQPNAVSKRLGHASVAITLDLYAHATREADDAITAAMEKRYAS